MSKIAIIYMFLAVLFYVLYSQFGITWCRYLPLLPLMLLSKGYLSTGTRFDGKIKMLPDNGTKDSKSKAILLISKVSWLLKKYTKNES